MTILIQDCTAITMGMPLVRRGVSIAIAQDKIAKISADPQEFAHQRFDKVIDGTNKLAIPGLVNAHTHLPMVLLRGYADDQNLQRWLEDEIWPAERKLTEEDVYWASLVGIAEMLRSGTTTFSDMYFFMDAVAQAVKESGMRALLSYGIIAPQPGPKADQELKITEEFLKRWHGQASGRIRVAVAPHAPYTCGDEIWRRAKSLAIEYNSIIHTHLQETQTEVDDSLRTFGQTPTERLETLGVLEAPTLAAHGVHLRDSDLEILKRYDVRLAHCPTSNLKLGSGIAAVRKWRQAQLTVGIGTDGAASNNNLDMLEETRLAALLAKLSDPTALPASEALEMATCGGARALGWDDLGSLEEGRKADLVLLDTQGVHWVPGFNPVSDLVYAAASADVETVIVDGQILMERREIQSFDEERAKAKVRQLRAKYQKQQ
ncbi:MAG: amidohydrolase [Candidatus Bipolaricaulota bacterium]|nr:amidohydrolase [Candidatus Bipolaricaulota bacterium]